MPVGEVAPKDDKFRAFTGDSQGPIKIVGAGFNTSEACSLACPGCYRGNSEGKSGYILPEIAIKMMGKLKENGVSEVYFLGAEPTENPALPEILKKAVEMEFKFVLLISNGDRLANEAYARQVLIPGVSLLMHRHTLGTDALAQRIREESVGKRGTLERNHQAWKNAEMIFREKGGKDALMMQACLTEAVMTGDNLDIVFRWARESLGTLPIMEYVSPPHTSEVDQFSWLVTYPFLTRQIVAQLERFMKIDEELGLKVPEYKNAMSPQAYNTSCTMLKEGGQITAGGVYLPCTNMGPESTHPVQFGNILLEPFDKIEQNQTRKAFIQPNFRVQACDDPCQGSGCWWTGLVTTGCYRMCQLNCVFNEKKLTIDDVPEFCNDCQLNELRKNKGLNCGPGTRPGLDIGSFEEKKLFNQL